AADLEHADADAVAGDAEPDSLAGQLVHPEEALQRLGQRLGLAQLAADDDAGLQGLARDLDELRRAVVDDARGREVGGADLQPDEPLLACRPRSGPSARADRARGFGGTGRFPRDTSTPAEREPALRLG